MAIWHASAWVNAKKTSANMVKNTYNNFLHQKLQTATTVEKIGSKPYLPKSGKGTKVQTGTAEPEVQNSEPFRDFNTKQELEVDCLEPLSMPRHKLCFWNRTVYWSQVYLKLYYLSGTLYLLHCFS